MGGGARRVRRQHRHRLLQPAVSVAGDVGPLGVEEPGDQAAPTVDGDLLTESDRRSGEHHVERGGDQGEHDRDGEHRAGGGVDRHAGNVAVGVVGGDVDGGAHERDEGTGFDDARGRPGDHDLRERPADRPVYLGDVADGIAQRAVGGPGAVVDVGGCFG